MNIFSARFIRWSLVHAAFISLSVLIGYGAFKLAGTSYDRLESSDALSTGVIASLASYSWLMAVLCIARYEWHIAALLLIFVSIIGFLVALVYSASGGSPAGAVDPFGEDKTMPLFASAGAVVYVLFALLMSQASLVHKISDWIGPRKLSR